MIQMGIFKRFPHSQIAWTGMGSIVGGATSSQAQIIPQSQEGGVSDCEWSEGRYTYDFPIIYFLKRT